MSVAAPAPRKKIVPTLVSAAPDAATTTFKDKKNPDLWLRYIPLHLKFKPKFFWLKGHAGHPENERCDQLAVAAAEQPNLPPDTVYEQQA